MPALLMRASVGEAHNWGASLERGTTAGLQAATEAVRDDAKAALAARVDPWGAAFAPPSPLTLKLRAAETEVGASIDSAFVVRKAPRKFTLTVQGRSYAKAHVMQFGSVAKQVFDNARTVVQPGRPFLPLRGETVDVPADLLATMEAVMARGVEMALMREPSRRR